MITGRADRWGPCGGGVVVTAKAIVIRYFYEAMLDSQGNDGNHMSYRQDNRKTKVVAMSIAGK